MRGIRIGDIDEDDDHLSHEWGSSNSEPRRGVSVCPSWDDLCTYFSTSPYQTGRGPRPRIEPSDVVGETIVVVEGERSPDSDHDEGDPGDPMLLVDVKVIERRELTPSEVCELCYGGRDFVDTDDVLQRLREMSQGYDVPTSIETVVGETPDSGQYDLGQLFSECSDSVVVWDDGGDDPTWRDESIVYHDGEFQKVPTVDIRRD